MRDWGDRRQMDRRGWMFLGAVGLITMSVLLFWAVSSGFPLLSTKGLLVLLGAGVLAWAIFAERD